MYVDSHHTYMCMYVPTSIYIHIMMQVKHSEHVDKYSKNKFIRELCVSL